MKDYLISLIIVSLMFPIIISASRMMSDLEYFDNDLQNELSILKLRDKLILAYDIKINDNKMSFMIADDESELIYDGKRLYLSPGYQLFLSDVSDLRYEIRGNLIYINYQSDNRYYERYIGII